MNGAHSNATREKLGYKAKEIRGETPRIGQPKYNRLEFTHTQYRAYITAGEGVRNGDFIATILRLGEVCRSLGEEVPYNPRWLTVGKGVDYYTMTIRRLLDRISSSKSWRRELPKPAETTLRDLVVDTNNRFNILLTDLYDVEVESHEFPETPGFHKDDVGRPLKEEMTLEERQYMNGAHSNATREKLGYKAKEIRGETPRIGQPKYNRLEFKDRRAKHGLRLLEILRRLKTWRTEYREELLNGKYLSIVPITLIEPIERWNAEYQELGGDPIPLGGSLIPKHIWYELVNTDQTSAHRADASTS